MDVGGSVVGLLRKEMMQKKLKQEDEAEEEELFKLNTTRWNENE